jgi:hypothetical protein
MVWVGGYCGTARGWQTGQQQFSFGFIRTMARLSSACMILALLFILRFWMLSFFQDAADPLTR